MNCRRHVLLICPTFPPEVGGGLARNIQYVRHLGRYGWCPTVLTVRRRQGPWSDATPLGSMPPGVRVVRTWSPSYGRAALGRGLSGRSSLASRLIAGARAAAVTWLLIPDREAPWIPGAVLAARRLRRGTRFDAVLSLGPPHSAHIVASLARGGLRWVVDTGDPWVGNPYAAHPWLRTVLEQSIERRVLGGADVVVTPTAALTDRFRARLPATVRCVTIPNGYDESEFVGVQPVRMDGLHIVHIGSFYAARSPEPFLAAVVRLMKSSPPVGSDLRVTFAGYADAPARASIAAGQRALGERTLRYLPFVPRREAIGLVLGADVLLLVTDTTPAGRELVPLKTYEYLRAGRPILALAPDGELRSALARTGGALCVDPRDIDAIHEALVLLLSGSERTPPATRALLADFEAAHLTRLLAEVLEA